MRKNFGFVFASKMLVENKKKVGFMYREKPDNPKDSGWRFFCGDEDDSYINNPNNIQIYDIQTIVQLDNSILPILSSPVGSAFERKDENTPLKAAKDYAFYKG